MANPRTPDQYDVAHLHDTGLIFPFKPVVDDVIKTPFIKMGRLELQIGLVSTVRDNIVMVKWADRDGTPVGHRFITWVVSATQGV